MVDEQLTHLSAWRAEGVRTCWAGCSCSSCSAKDRTARHCSGRRDMLSCLWSSEQLKAWIIRERQVPFLSVRPQKQMSKGKERDLERKRGGAVAAPQKDRGDRTLPLSSFTPPLSPSLNLSSSSHMQAEAAAHSLSPSLPLFLSDVSVFFLQAAPNLSTKHPAKQVPTWSN